jgi:outer membrane receptor protein involved in Fe transport
MRRRALSLALQLVLALSVSDAARAQVTTGQISGTVRDATDAVIPFAEITLVNVGTGVSRTVKVDPHGRYDAPSLSLGQYEIVVTADGFKTEVRGGVNLTVGQHAVLNFTLQPGTVSEQVTVVSEAPLVETSTSQVGALVSREQIHEMPLNGRDYTQLALLQPGVVQYREQSRELNRGTGTRFSIAGARHNQVGFRLNGIDINDGSGTTPGSATGHNLGVDAIQEFQVLTNTFTAEQGKAAGGIVNVVHKSGTNALHGAAFEYHRNSSFDARNFFDLGDDPAPFLRNQFGVSAGGPILRNRTFFFGAYEGLRERLDRTGINIVLTDAVKNGAFGPVDPRVKPYLDQMPSVNGREFADGTGERITTVRTRSTENYVVGKIDHTFSTSDTISGSYTYDAGDVTAPDPRAGILTYETASRNRYHYLTLQETHIFTPNVLHSLRGGYNRSHVDAIRHPLIEFPSSLAFLPGVNVSTIQIAGVDGFQPHFGDFFEREIELDSWQIANTLTWVRGAHTFKTGMEAYRTRVANTTPGRTAGGLYDFRSLADFLVARADVFQADDPEAPSKPTITQGLFGFFVQDDFRVKDNLTINAGLRYEFITTPRSTEPNQSTLINITDPQLTTGHTFMKNPSLKNFAPRLGFSWDVFGSQRTALRGGVGMYHDQITSYFYLPVIESNPPFALTRTLPFPPFPNAYELFATGELPSLFGLQLLEYDMKQPYRIQYNLGLQQQLGATMAAAVYYVGARGVHSSQFFANANTRAPRGTSADGRLFFSANDPPLNPNFGPSQLRTMSGDSWYDSLQLVVNRRPRGGLAFQASYTFQKMLDTGSVLSFTSEGLNTVVQQSPFAAGPEYEKGLSSFDVRHTFSLNATYDLPVGGDWTGVLRALGAGWQLSGIVTLASGHPFTPILGFDNANVLTRSRGDHLRPDLAPGASSNPVNPGNVNRYFDPTAFVLPPAGTLGNLARNTIIGPGLSTIDLGAKKRFIVASSRAVEFRVEVFNLANHANFRIPEATQRTVLNRGNRLNESAGLITTTTTPSRQIQLSGRFEF